ncbi:MAG: RNA-directed DNA polymerase [Chloroflexi bacterium]|nr:RNA-directed DNA polymerase [Chloroflexota bacterium]
MSTSDTDTKVDVPASRSILELTSSEATAFLLEQESYCRIDLPPYFHFDSLLASVDSVLGNENLHSLQHHKSRDYENVNHPILNNKDGRYAWRPLQLIHPALYVSLARTLTESGNWEALCDRFAEFSGVEKIMCLGLPVKSSSEEKDRAAQVSSWWHEIEQRSIKLALDYEYTIHADITDCYGAIYTHTVAWAIHGKERAKEKRTDKNLIGNKIDRLLQDMHHGQTNGIPQGSALMDFIAEMVLGYADLELAKKLDGHIGEDHLVLRYRDDYRIFVNNPQEGEKILKCLTEVMIDLGLKLNASKTVESNQVVSQSIKPDKLAWMSTRHSDKNLQKHLLIIHSHAAKFPNTGSVAVALADYHKRLMRRSTIQDPLSLISIAVDIAYRNPRTYPVCSAILSRLLCFLESEAEKKDVIAKILRRFSQIPNTGHMEIWLQRITLPFAPDMKFGEPLCNLVQGENVQIWNNEWISSQYLRDALDPGLVFDAEIAAEIDPVIPTEEVELFMARNRDYQ